MSPTHTRKGRSSTATMSASRSSKGRRWLPDQPRARRRDRARRHRPASRPPSVAGDHRRDLAAARKEIEGLTEAEVREALERLDPLWDELFPAEQARIVQLLVEQVQVDQAGLDISLRAAGLTSLIDDLRANQRETAVPNAIPTVADPDTITIRVPIAFRRHGGRKTLAAPTVSPTLVERGPDQRDRSRTSAFAPKGSLRSS